MRLPAIITLSLFSMALVSAQGCATRSVSGNDDLAIAEELIKEPIITDVPWNPVAATASRTSPMMRAEVSARQANGPIKGALDDVLFDFDRASLRLDALPVLEANASRITADGISRVLLEGRGDEVGTAAYNMVLGDRRARNVQSYLKQLGLVAEIRTMSFGKDRPLCFQHHPECLQMNRSVHFVIQR